MHCPAAQRPRHGRGTFLNMGSDSLLRVSAAMVLMLTFRVTSAREVVTTPSEMRSPQERTWTSDVVAEREGKRIGVTSAEAFGMLMTSGVTSPGNSRRSTFREENQGEQGVGVGAGVWRRLQKGEKCVQTGPCSCRASAGVIDLSPLADNFTAKFKDVLDTQGANLYSWNPCLTFTEDDCVDVASCQLTPGLNRSSKAIGSQGTARFLTNQQGDLTLQYTYPDPSGVNRTTIVTLDCDPNGDSAISVYGEMVAFQYSLGLISPFCCVRRED